MWVLQISDLHLDAGALPAVDIDGIARLLRDRVVEKIGGARRLAVAFCGDATWQGRTENYATATRFFTKLRHEFPIDIDIDIFSCPGNHDICLAETNRFAPFNRFAREIATGGRQSFASDVTAHVERSPDADFILVNSAHHYDHKFGLVEIDHLDHALRESANPLKIMVIHHHLVPMDESDRSTTANAYEVLALAATHEVTAILHGHRHMQSGLLVGTRGCALLGVGSLFFPPDRNLNNQFNLLDLHSHYVSTAVTYKLIADASTHGRVEEFESFPVNLY
jgi:3',5'-cyclic AMP phosphodiesterase CpdA